MKKAVAWIQASRLASQSYIFLPILLGQSIWFFQTGEIAILPFILIQLFGLFDQLYIVYANDYADIETDKLNKTPTIFSGGSRVLVEHYLEPADLKRGSWLMVLSALATGLVLTIAYDRILILPMMIFQCGHLMAPRLPLPPIAMATLKSTS